VEEEGPTDVLAPQGSGGAKGHIMISYNWGNQEMIKTIKKGLADRGFNVWLDVEQMSGSTLEAMAHAVEQAVVVLVCYSKKYKESAACRTEAEYAFTLKKPIIPLKMEKDYVPDGWLGALLGSKLYHEFSSLEAPAFASPFPVLVKAIGARGKGLLERLAAGQTPGAPAKDIQSVEARLDIMPWGCTEVATWLDSVDLPDYKSNFQKEDMDGKALVELFQILGKSTATEFSAVIAPLGFRTLGHRLRFQQALKALCQKV